MGKRCWCILLGIICLSVYSYPVCATETETVDVVQKIYDERPKTNSIKGWPQGPNIWGEGAIVMDMESGAILYEKNSKKQFYPASITKLLTALVALKNSELTDIVTGSESSYDGMDYTYVSLGLKPGEQMSMEDALYGLLLASANEVGHAIAESSVDGGYDAFIKEMNEEAKSLGCINSNFINTNGIHDENHYTCAYDMALIGTAVYQIPEFREIEKNILHDIPATNMSDARIGLIQNDKMMLPDNSHYCEYIKAGKTGFTDAAKTTLVSMADNGDLRLTCVDLANAKALIYEDTRAMCDYVFQNFKKISLSQNEHSEDIVTFENKEAYVLVPKDVKFEDLKCEIQLKEEKGSAVVHYSYQGQPVGNANAIISEKCYERMSGKYHITLKNGKKEVSSDIGIAKKSMIVLAVFLIGILLLIWFNVTIYKKRKLKRRYRKKRRR